MHSKQTILFSNLNFLQIIVINRSKFFAAFHFSWKLLFGFIYYFLNEDRFSISFTDHSTQYLLKISILWSQFITNQHNFWVYWKLNTLVNFRLGFLDWGKRVASILKLEATRTYKSIIIKGETPLFPPIQSSQKIHNFVHKIKHL